MKAASHNTGGRRAERKAAKEGKTKVIGVWLPNPLVALLDRGSANRGLRSLKISPCCRAGEDRRSRKTKTVKAVYYNVRQRTLPEAAFPSSAFYAGLANGSRCPVFDEGEMAGLSLQRDVPGAKKGGSRAFAQFLARSPGDMGIAGSRGASDPAAALQTV